MAYFDKKEGETKGTIPIFEISNIQSKEKKVFVFLIENREFILRADSEDAKQMWIDALNMLKDELDRTSNDVEIDIKTRNRGKSEKVWKMENQSKDTIDVKYNIKPITNIIGLKKNWHFCG